MSLEDQETGSVHDELPKDCQQVSSLPAVMKTSVSEMEAEEQTTARQEILPQDMGWVAMHCWALLYCCMHGNWSANRQLSAGRSLCRVSVPECSERPWPHHESRLSGLWLAGSQIHLAATVAGWMLPYKRCWEWSRSWRSLNIPAGRMGEITNLRCYSHSFRLWSIGDGGVGCHCILLSGGVISLLAWQVKTVADITWTK